MIEIVASPTGITLPSTEQRSVRGSGAAIGGLAYSTRRARLLVAQEGLKAGHLPIVDLDHPPGLLIELDPATPAAEVHVTEHHDFVAVLPKDLAMDLPDLALSSIVAGHA